MMLSCKDATRLVSMGQDRALGFAERAMLRVHLAICRGCGNAARQLEFLRRAMARLAEQDGTAER